MQKGVIAVLRAEGYFDDNDVVNEETGMQIAITAKEIKKNPKTRNVADVNKKQSVSMDT